MSARVFVARLVGLAVFDPLGDPVGRVRDVILTFPAPPRPPRAVGLVVEVPGRRRVFLPITRVTSIDAGQVIITGVVNLRRFASRPREVLAVGELLDRRVQLHELDEPQVGVVEDLAIERDRSKDWLLTKVFVRLGPPPARGIGRLARRRGETRLVDVSVVQGLLGDASSQGASALVRTYDEMRAADIADAIQDLSPHRRSEVAHALDDERLADVLEELPEEDQVTILTSLDVERAADILEEMEPDDAADLLAELTPRDAETLLQRMEPDEAAPLRRLLAYADDTAGGLMTPEPVIVAPDATVAECLALVRRAELSPAVASTVFVARSPLETPTGRLLGSVHFQALLREPPHSAVGHIIDREVTPVEATAPLDQVSRIMASYNLVSLPVIDEDHRLLGAVTIDDVLDHILPEDWREAKDATEAVR